MNNSTKYNEKLNLIGNTIRYYRTQNKLSLSQLSVKLQLLGIDIPKNSLQRLEKGNRIIKEYELAALSKVFKVSTDVLLKDVIESFD